MRESLSDPVANLREAQPGPHTKQPTRPCSSHRMLAIGYVRVSTDEQADSGLGLEAQRAVLRAEAERRGWDLEIVEDAGYTGRNLRRPALAQALERLDRGDHHALISAKLDRLSRSVRDFSHLMAQAQKNGWAIVCLDLGVDTTTPSGEAMANVMATFAQLEGRLIGQRTKDALAQKRKQGVKLGRPRSVCDEALTHIRTLRSFGCSYRRIADYLNEESVPTAQGGKWWPETVRQIDQRAN